VGTRRKIPTGGALEEVRQLVGNRFRLPQRKRTRQMSFSGSYTILPANLRLSFEPSIYYRFLTLLRALVKFFGCLVKPLHWNGAPNNNPVTDRR